MLIMTGVQLEMACGIHTATWVVAATTFSTCDWRFSDRGWIVSGNDQLNGGYATESPVFPAKSFYGRDTNRKLPIPSLWDYSQLE